MSTTYRVTGVFVSDSSREEISRDVTVEGELDHERGAISVVDCEALKAGKLLLSAKAVRLVSISVSNAVLLALSLDDPAMQVERNLAVESINGHRSGSRVTGSAWDIAIVLDDILDRSVAGNWDQPGSWTRSCALAWPKVREQVEAQGYVVAVKGQYKTVSVVRAEGR